MLADGGRVLAPGVTSTVIGGYLGGRHGADAEHRAARLTCRERQVLALVGEGLSNNGIAQRLDLAHGTVKDHVSALLAKLGGLNRVQAAVLADRAGLVGCLSAERPGQSAPHEAAVPRREPERHGTPETREAGDTSDPLDSIEPSDASAPLETGETRNPTGPSGAVP